MLIDDTPILTSFPLKFATVTNMISFPCEFWPLHEYLGLNTSKAPSNVQYLHFRKPSTFKGFGRSRILDQGLSQLWTLWKSGVLC